LHPSNQEIAYSTEVLKLCKEDDPATAPDKEQEKLQKFQLTKFYNYKLEKCCALVKIRVLYKINSLRINFSSDKLDKYNYDFASIQINLIKISFCD
jgi:hypothetical protein